MTPENILITGGSGMIGRRLTTLLTERGYRVSHLTRSQHSSQVKTFLWAPDRGWIDEEALENADAIVHLAGAGIADKRWNERRKAVLLSSRVESSRIIADNLQKNPRRVRAVISASGISYYGLEDPPSDSFRESDTPGEDFMAQVTVAWEREINRINDPSIRTVFIRTGVVLSEKGGALEKLVLPVRYFVGAPLGSGRQFVNWIHLDDLCGMYIKAIEDTRMHGPYNGVAPNPISNRELTKQIARVLKRPLWLPPVPGFVVKLIAGEVAELVLKGGKISSQKIQETEFEFEFETVDAALQELLSGERPRQ